MRLVCYTDGSCLGNPGFAGFGVYGYLLEEAKRPTAIKCPFDSNYSYGLTGLTKERMLDNVKLVNVYEHIESIEGVSTNSTAELLAFKTVLELAINTEGVKEVFVMTDSKYVKRNYEEFIDVWISNGWKKSDGEPPVNVNVWKRIDEIRKMLVSLGIKVEIDWTKGHAGEPGNELVDDFARIASSYSKRNEYQGKVLLEEWIESTEYRKSFDYEDIAYQYRSMLFGSVVSNDEDKLFLSITERDELVGKRDINTFYTTMIGDVNPVLKDAKSYFRSFPRVLRTYCNMTPSRLLEKRNLLRLSEKIGISNVLDVVKQPNGTYKGYLPGDKVPILEEYMGEQPYIVEAGRVFSRMSGIEEGERFLEIDVTDRVVKEGKLVIDNKDKYLEISETDLATKGVKTFSKLMLEYGVDILPYLRLNKITKDIKRVVLVVEFNSDSNYVTVYSVVFCNNIKIISTNLIDKFIVSRL